jgi:sugar lactone lactonase YvrE
LLSFICIANILFVLIAVSYNQPKLNSCALWDLNGTAIITAVAVIGHPSPSIFINNNNTIYMVDQSNRGRMQVYLEGSTSPNRNISISYTYPSSIFVDTDDDIYVSLCISFSPYVSQVFEWTTNASSNQTVMTTSETCSGLFIDLNNALYCSMFVFDAVVKKSLSNATAASITIAGNGSYGSGPSMLTFPQGIFVDINFTLYVADSGNGRIQKLMSGQSNAVTVAGNGASGIIFLSGPSGVVLDADGYLFITDSNNYRIIGSGPDGFRCVVRCSGSSGSTADQLHSPYMMSFDSDGNIFVADTGNQRIQKFLLSTGDSCGMLIHR